MASISSLEPGMQGTVIGRVVSKGVLPTRKGLRIFQAVLRDDSGMIEVSWPGQPYLDRTIDKDDVLLVSGSVRFFHGRQLQPREFVNLGDEDAGTAQGRVLSVYPATEGLSFKVIRGIIDAHLDALLPLVTEYLPRDVLRRRRRAGHRRCAAHGAPPHLARRGDGGARAARVRGAALRAAPPAARQGARARDAPRASASRTGASSPRGCAKSLPFQLTGAQVRVLREIVADMCSERRMQRLLQGDVGSGKTIVALFAALLAMENGYQAAIMAPTELLAEQHMRTMSKLLAPLGIAPLLVTGSLKARARAASSPRASRSAEPLLVVGTHALVQEATAFAQLGLAVIDEQHRFGVEQRKALGAKGESPDVLLMTATPIPRSLALTLYGDLDLSHPRRAAAGPAADHHGAAPARRPRERVLAVRRPRDRQGPAGVRRLSGDRGVGEDRPQGRDDDVRDPVRRTLRRTALRAAARTSPRRREGRHHAALPRRRRSTCSSPRR